MRPLYLATACVVALGLAVSASAQPAPFDDPEASFVKDLVVTAPTGGPAWWKVSKGRSVVWIIALPPSNVPRNLSWDKSVLKRRMRGARMLLMPPEGRARFEGSWRTPLADPIPSRVAEAAGKLGVPQGRYLPATVPRVFALRDYYFRANRLAFPIDSQVVAEANLRRVKVVRPLPTDIALTADMLDSKDPEVQTCVTALLTEVETDPQTLRNTAALWAQGRVANVIATPRSAWTYCINRIFPGYSRRAIEAQAKAIAAALDAPGKSVAVAPLRLLVAEDGILQRLQAQGYTIADPARPLSN